jgi:hypothetical protein
MITAGVVTRQHFEGALQAAAAVGNQEPLTGLAAPLDATWLGRISETWDMVEAALREAYLWGRDAAQQALADAIAQAEQLLRSAGKRARDVHQALLERAQAYLTVLIRSALAQVHGVLDVAGTKLKLVSVEVAQSISLTGSLKASITELVALTGAGEISVSASYGS